MRTRRAFDYKPPTFEEAKKLSEKRGGLFDAIVKRDGPRFLKPKNGDNFIRIMPPTWENAKHYALEVKIHRNIGVDNASYLCLRENEFSPEKDCPICEERNELARRKVAQKDIDDLRANTNMLVYLIDRHNESQGPQLWGMSHRSDAEILSQSLEKRQAVYLPIAHPIDGYDVEFTREGEGLMTRYRGFKVSRASSPITDDADKMDEWLHYIEDNTIPELCQFFYYDHIKLVLTGRANRTTKKKLPRECDAERGPSCTARCAAPHPEPVPNGSMKRSRHSTAALVSLTRRHHVACHSTKSVLHRVTQSVLHRVTQNHQQNDAARHSIPQTINARDSAICAHVWRSVIADARSSDRGGSVRHSQTKWRTLLRSAAL
jgi:hypothetical protein